MKVKSLSGDLVVGNVIRDPRRLFVDFVTIEPSYIIYKDGNLYYAKNGRTAEIVSQGKDASAVIQDALNVLTTGRKWKEKVVLKGDFEISSSLLLDSYTIFDASQARLKAKDGLNAPVIRNKDQTNGNNYIEVYIG